MTMSNVFVTDSIKDRLGIKVSVSTKMKNAINAWYKAYINESDWLKNDVKSLNIAASVASEIARLVTVESEIEITGSPRAEYINKQLREFKKRKKNIVETACSVGGVVFKPYVSGGKIYIDYIYQDEMLPFKYDDNDMITGIIFPSYKIDGSKRYTRLEIHDYNDVEYTISNRCFVSKDTTISTNEVRGLGSEISLDSVIEWADIEPEVTIRGLERPLFSFFKIPIANNIDRKSPLGVSVYARSIADIKDADTQAARIDWEFESKETAIETDESYISEDIYGNQKLPKGKERMFRLYSGETLANGEKLFKHFSPDIRDESFFRGLDKILKRIEFNSGLAYGTLSDPQNVDKTAEEIKSSKQRSYQLVKDIQGSLETSIVELIDVMDSICTMHNIVPEGRCDTVFTWDDSIIVDSEKERMQDLQDVRDGLLPKWKYKMKWQGLSEEQAKAELSDDSGILYEDE